MVSIGAYEAKTHLPRLLERVAKGERILITKHGVPVAELSPVNTVPASDRQQAIERLRSFRKGKSAERSVREMIEEGRK